MRLIIFLDTVHYIYLLKICAFHSNIRMAESCFLCYNHEDSFLNIKTNPPCICPYCKMMQIMVSGNSCYCYIIKCDHQRSIIRKEKHFIICSVYNVIGKYKKQEGPNMKPWGTSAFICHWVDSIPPKTTFCLRPVK